MAGARGDERTEAAGDDAARREPTGRVAFLDQALWKHFRDAASPQDFARAWLALQCRMIGGVASGVVLLGKPDAGPFSPVAAWPEDGAAGPELLTAAENALAERRGVVSGRKATGTEQDVAIAAVAYPFIFGERLNGAVAIDIASRADGDLPAVLRGLQWGAAWIEVMLRRQAGDDSQAAQQRTATTLDLVATAIEEEGFRAACNAVVTDMATRLECDRVSVGFRRGGHVVVAALSHSAQFGKRMNLVRAIASAMDEALDQHTIIHYPAGPEGEYRVTRAHGALASGHGQSTIVTIPLTAHDRDLGAVTFERPQGRDFSQDTIDVAECVAAAIGPILDDKRRNDRLVLLKVVDAARRQLQRLVGARYLGRKLVVAAAVALVVFFAVATGDYRVTAPARLEGLVQRTVAAPFDGFVLSEHKRAGDTATTGEVLAVLDDSDLALEHLRWITTRRQRVKEYERALAERDRAQLNIIKAQIEQADAQVALFAEQLGRAQLVAPFDGVIVAGDLSQSVGASVERGQQLFEIAPLDSYRVILEVDETDIAALTVGQTGTVLLSSLIDTPLGFTVDNITPVAEASEGRNRFRVEARLDDVNGRLARGRLRPGMEGVGKANIDRRRLIWIGTHRLVDWARIKVWAWWP